VLRRYRRVAVLAVVTTLAGLCATVATPAQAQTANPFAHPSQFCVKHSPPPGTRNSSHPGIKPDSITFVEGSAFQSNAALQGVQVVSNEAIYKALTAEINDCGGINGRKLIMKRVPSNSSNPDPIGHSTANCLKNTEDIKAFMAINATNSNVFPRCMSVQHKTILLTGNGGLFDYADQVDSKGRIMSRYLASDMSAKAFVQYGLSHSFFKNKKVMVIGVYREASTAQDLQKQWVDPLKAKGVDAYLEVLPCIGASNCRSQIGAVAARAKSNDVDVIVTTGYWVLGTLGVLFRNMQEMNFKAQVMGPVILAIHADGIMGAHIADTGVAGARWADDMGVQAFSYDDFTTIGAVRTGTKITKFGQMCLDILNKRMKNNPAWSYSVANVTRTSNNYWTVATAACREMRSFARAIYSLGNNVTTERAVTAMEKEVPDKVDTTPNFFPYTWYSRAHPSPTKIAALKYTYPCPDTSPVVPCFIPQDRPVRARPIS
jgi:ABC-type branched-subunit amino acid transport system substrate-binding protein